MANVIIPRANNNPPKVMGKGSYGCIFRPGISCNVDEKLTDKYITKVQISRNTTLENETNIGNKIKQIKNYKEYYAPILSSCEVSLSRVSEKEITKCGMLEKGDSYSASKLRYVGKNTLMKHLLTKYMERAMRIVDDVVETHNELLEGYSKLNDAGIIHYDVKENNIMCKDKRGTPIIIDFGLSIDILEVAKNSYRDAFYVYGPDYGPWCLEIAMISYGANELVDESISNKGYVGFGNKENPLGLEQEVTKEQIGKVIGEFVKTNYSLLELISQDVREKYREKMIEHYSKYIGKRWKEMIEELQTYYKTWDNYGLSIMYLHIIDQLKIGSAPNQSVYKAYLEEIVLSLPSDRADCKKTKEYMKEIFGKVKRSDKKKQGKYMRIVSINGNIRDKVHKEVWHSIKNELQRDKKLYEKRIQQ